MIYLDTSFLVSLYCPDANSAHAAALMRRVTEPMLITTLCELEAVNALALRVFRKEISQRHADVSLQNLDADIRTQVFQLSILPETAFARARTLSRLNTPKLGTRTADLLHVAAAVELGAATLFSFDLQQRKAAKAAGLKMNPMP